MSLFQSTLHQAGQTLLSLSTSHSQGSPCLYHEENFLTQTWQTPRRHSERLPQALIELLEKNNIPLEVISDIVIDVGPGSFTGIRAGVNFVKAFAFCQKTQIHTLNSLALLLEGRSGLALSRASSQDFYVLNSLEGPDVQSKSLKETQKILSFAKNCFIFCTQMLPELTNLNPELSCKVPDAKTLLTLFLENPQLFQKSDWSSLKPYYVKKSSPEELLEKVNLKT